MALLGGYSLLAVRYFRFRPLEGLWEVVSVKLVFIRCRCQLGELIVTEVGTCDLVHCKMKVGKYIIVMARIGEWMVF